MSIETWVCSVVLVSVVQVWATCLPYARLSRHGSSTVCPRDPNNCVSFVYKASSKDQQKAQQMLE